MTAEINSSVAENAVCWCEGWKKRRSFFIETRSEGSILSESQAVRQLSGGHSRRSRCFSRDRTGSSRPAKPNYTDSRPITIGAEEQHRLCPPISDPHFLLQSGALPAPIRPSSVASQEMSADIDLSAGARSLPDKVRKRQAA